MRRSKRCVTSTQKRRNTSTKQNETQGDREDESAISVQESHGVQARQSISPAKAESAEKFADTSPAGIAGGEAGERIENQKSEAKERSTAMPDLFYQDEDGDTYLHIAVVQCNEGLVNFLIQAMKSIKVDIYNNLRQTPLHLAVITGQQNLIGLLIKAGCDVNAMDRNGQTPLHLACQRNDVESARAIFESGDDRQIKRDIKNFDGLTALHLATAAGNRDLIGLMIDRGADINIKDTNSGRTPLHHAVEAGKHHVVEFFLSRGANANVTTYSGNTPLHTAAGRHMEEMIRILSRHGADVNLANMEGDKPRVVLGSEQGQRQLAASRKRSRKVSNVKSSKTGETSTKKTKS